MEHISSGLQLLNLLQCPAFIVSEGCIAQLNPAAQAMAICPGQSVDTLFDTHKEALASLDDGCLYLEAQVAGQTFGAGAVRTAEGILVLLDAQPEGEALRALSLAAREMRGAMVGMQLSLDELHKTGGNEKTAALLERSLHQMLRLVCNMTDAGTLPSQNRQEILDLDSWMEELTEKAAASAEALGVSIRYSGSGKAMLTLCDEELLERAVLNILSNSLKFTPAGGAITVKLTAVGRYAQIQITDTGSGIAAEMRSSLFHRYLRQSAIEDSRFGVGLGMVTVRKAALAHGGTVLVDAPQGAGTRVTLTIAIRQDCDILRSPMMLIDYAGEHDRIKLELSDVLPLESYLQ